ncbi:GGDEF domain-containing protein [Parasalinivibrio latis]|uniref:GGDEF domain-containing protein n=1 Tax=Parasalinivibrio latis TaxID=2952610 RepID=UPI0030E4CA5D
MFTHREQDAYYRFQLERHRPLLVRLFLIGAVIIFSYGFWEYSLDRTHFETTFFLRVLAALAVLSCISVLYHPKYNRWLVEWVGVVAVFSIVCITFSYSQSDKSLPYLVSAIAYYTVTALVVAPMMPLKFLAFIYLVAYVCVLGILIVTGRMAMFDEMFIATNIHLVPLMGYSLAASFTIRRISSLEFELQKELKELARKDSLTGVLNRQAFVEDARELWKQPDTSIALAVVDLDDFKSVNDNFGHNAGDLALMHVSATLQSSVRETDVICRWGGEEFVVLIANTDPQTTLKIANRIRANVEGTVLVHDHDGFTVTASIGVAFRGTHRTLDELVNEADKALYLAKGHGKNQVRTSAPLNAV